MKSLSFTAPLERVTVYTDGACSGNGQGNARGGWAAVIVSSVGPRELSGSESDTTNQRMELRAAIEGLKALTAPAQVTVISDSAYVVNCFLQGWYAGWRRRGWRNSQGKPVANRDLWEELLDLVEHRGHRVEFVKVAGHADALARVSNRHEVYNQRCDALAVAASA